MGLYKTTPPLSDRMGTLWTLSTIRGAAVIEFGCMGHMAYGRTFLHRMGAYGAGLFSTHLKETDIALGDVTRLHEAVRQVIEEERVKTIFLLPSSVPEIIGIDLLAIAMELSVEYPGIRFIPFETGGVEQTLLVLADAFSRDGQKTKKPSYSIIGSCADMFRFQADAEELKRIMDGAFQMECLCMMTSDTDVTGLEQLGQGHVNLVIRREGVAAAKFLEQRYGTPYLFARPYGIAGTRTWIEQVGKMAEVEPNDDFVLDQTERMKARIGPMEVFMRRFWQGHSEECRLIAVGHPDVVGGITTYGKEQFGFRECQCYYEYQDMKGERLMELAAAVKTHGVLMGSEELLQLAGKGKELQIANPDSSWRHAYEPPFVGYRGAVHLGAMWVNEMMKK
ncbi:MAG: nitrogenase component 1 [Lachnospiraceae bacterium]